MSGPMVRFAVADMTQRLPFPARRRVARRAWRPAVAQRPAALAPRRYGPLAI